MKNQNHYPTIWIISLLIFFHIRHEHLMLISFYSWSNHLNLWFVRGELKIKQLVFHWKWFHVSLSSSNESSVGGISVIAIFNLTCAKLLVIKSRVFFLISTPFFSKQWNVFHWITTLNAMIEYFSLQINSLDYDPLQFFCLWFGIMSGNIW